VTLDESEWQNDAEALADWEAWINTIEPLEYTDEERESLARYREDFRRCNLEAVRKQMGLGEGAWFNDTEIPGIAVENWSS
jgi:hypothetical protein